MDSKRLYKVFRFVFFVCFLFFLTFYIAGESGYYEYNERKKMIFTKEQIEKFEEDVRGGQNVDLNEYLSGRDVNRQNKLSKAILGVSEGISKYTKIGLTFIFNKISKVVEE